MRTDTNHHLVDSIHYVEHLMLGDVPVIVNIVESEGPWNKEINLGVFTAVQTSRVSELLEADGHE